MILNRIKVGQLLLSSPQLDDDNFLRSVVLIVENNLQGTIGFVLNQPLNVSIQEVSNKITAIENHIYKGGPCELNTLHFIHRAGKQKEDSIEITKGVYWGGNHLQLIEKINKRLIPATDVKFFIGYSGWGLSQLNEEFELNSWIKANAHMEDVFDTKPELLWQKILKNKGTKYAILSNSPLDPSWN